jgi:hypothetical protein
VFAEPTIDDFNDLIEWHLDKALERAARAVTEVRGEFARAGGVLHSGAVTHSLEAARREWDSGAEAVLGELRRVVRITNLDRNELRQHTVQSLMGFAGRAKAAFPMNEARSLGMTNAVEEQFAAFDRHVQFQIRQFDVGFLDPAEPEIPPVANSITIGSMTGCTIQQGSPGAKQTVEVTLDFDAMRKALDVLQAALVASTAPREKVDQLTAEVETIRAQLKKPSPSRLILREAESPFETLSREASAEFLRPRRYRRPLSCGLSR